MAMGTLEVARRAGLQGERVVVKANFLIDAESNRRPRWGGLGPRGQGGHGANCPDVRPRQSVPLPAPRLRSNRNPSRRRRIVEAVDFAHAIGNRCRTAPLPASGGRDGNGFSGPDPGPASTLKPAQKIVFDIVEDSTGEYVIVRIRSIHWTPMTCGAEAAGAGSAAPAPPAGTLR